MFITVFRGVAVIVVSMVLMLLIGMPPKLVVGIFIFAFIVAYAPVHYIQGRRFCDAYMGLAAAACMLAMGLPMGMPALLAIATAIITFGLFYSMLKYLEPPEMQN